MTFREWIGLSKTPRYEVARWLGPLLFSVVVLIGTGLLALVLFRSFEALVGGTGELRSYLYFLVALIGLPFVIWRTRVAQHQSQTAEQGLFTDHFTRAIEQIGSTKIIKTAPQNVESGGAIVAMQIEESVPNLEVGLGAIYALQRLSRDNLDDYLSIMEIFCAYIRANASNQTEYAKDYAVVVTSQKVVWLFFKQLRLHFVPVFHRLQWRLAAQG